MNKNHICFLLIPLLLVGCNSQKNTDNSGAQKDDSNAIIKKDVTIDFLSMTDGNYLATLKSIVNSFMEEEPHVKVNIYNPLGSGNYGTLERYVVSGFFKEDYPDLVQCYPDNVLKYIAHDKVVKLDSYLNNDTYGIKDQEDDYIETFMSEGRAYDKEGTTYSLPFCKSTELLYYNEDALVGLNLSSVDNTINNGQPLDVNYLDSLTWEEFFGKLCPAIKTYNAGLSDENKIYDDSDSSSCILAVDSDENFFITLAHQYGYGYTSVDENQQGSIDFGDDNNLKDLMKTLKSAKDNKYLQTKGTYKTYISGLFTSKKALFTISSNAGLSYNIPYGDNAFSVGVAHIPYAEGRSYSSINQGPSVCILDHNDNDRVLASFLLWKHLTNESNATKWALSTGYMTIRNSTYSSQEYIDAITISDSSTSAEKTEAENFKKLAEVKDYTFNTALFKGSGEARTCVGRLLTACLNNPDLDANIDDLFEEYATEAKKHLGAAA